MVSDSEPRYRLVDSQGNTVGTLYAKSGGTLALQEGSSGSNNEIELQTDGTLQTDSLNTKEQSVTNETFIRGTRGTETSSQAAGTPLNAFDGESKDVRGEFNSSAQFVPDKGGEYDVNIGIEFTGSTTAGDGVGMRFRDVDNNQDIGPQDRKRIDASGDEINFSTIVQLTAGTTYEVQVFNLDSSFKIGTASEGVIRLSVVS